MVLPTATMVLAFVIWAGPYPATLVVDAPAGTQSVPCAPAVPPCSGPAVNSHTNSASTAIATIGGAPARAVERPLVRLAPYGRVPGRRVAGNAGRRSHPARG